MKLYQMSVLWLTVAPLQPSPGLRRSRGAGPRVLLPGEREARALDAVDRQVEGVTLAGGEPLGLAPEHGPAGHAGRRVRQVLDRAARGPHAGERDLADVGEGVLTVVHPLGVVDRLLIAGDVEEVGIELLLDVPVAVLIELVLDAVARRALIAVLADPGDQDVLAGDRVRDALHVAGEDDAVFEVERRLERGLGEVLLLPGLAVVEGDGAEGVALVVGADLVAGGDVVARALPLGLVPVGREQRLGVFARLDELVGLVVGVPVGEVLEQDQRAVARGGVDVELEHAHLRLLRLEVGCARDRVAHHRAVIGHGWWTDGHERHEGAEEDGLRRPDDGSRREAPRVGDG